jgi:hypothetical protein
MTKEEFNNIRPRLEGLSIDELREIVTNTGITFSIGNENITDRDELTLVLDESDKEDVERELKRLGV